MSGAATFVGRQSELRLLGERLAEARIGHPQVVYVEADPGAGKSTLVSHFLGALTGAALLEAGGDEEETLLTYGIVDQLRPGLRAEPGTDPMAVGGELLDLLDRLQAGGGVVVLSIDDLQWADRSSSRAVLFALRRLRADKVLTIVSTRVGGVVDPGWSRFMGGDARATRIRLGGFTAGDLIELANALSLGVLSQRGAARLVAHTEGNALYCRALLDEIGVAALNTGDGGLPAPRELAGVILTRMAALPLPTQEFLAAAAVLGLHAPASMIASVALVSEAKSAMDGAVRAGLLTAGVSASELNFVHPLFRAAIYADLSPTSRRELHARAAEQLTGRLRLTHLVAASLGSDAALADELEASAITSAAVGDAGATAWALEQAASLSTSAKVRERRLLDAAAALLNSADTAAAARVSESCQSSGARRDALAGLLDVFRGSLSAEDRLLAVWQAHDPLLEVDIGACAATSLANWMVVSGRPDRALMWAERAVAATVPDSALRAMALTAQAYGFAADGRSREGLAGLEFLPDSGIEVLMAETDALIMRGMLKVYVDDLPGAIVDLGIAAARMRAGLPATYPVPCRALE